MIWNNLTSAEQLSAIDVESKNHAVLIYKHSTRCGICDAVMNRIERNWKGELESTLKPYYLDLLKYRSISNEISIKYNIEHQSPQVLVIRDGKCIYTESQMGISLKEILVAIQ